MVRRLKSAQEGIPFLDILLDETICEGEILAPEELVRAAGGINERLRAKQMCIRDRRRADSGAVGNSQRTLVGRNTPEWRQGWNREILYWSVEAVCMERSANTLQNLRQHFVSLGIIP